MCAGVRPEFRSTNAGDTFASRRNGGACRARRLARARKHREQQESPLSSVELGAIIWTREIVVRSVGNFFFCDSLNRSFSQLISPLPEFKNVFQIYPPVGPCPMEGEFFIIKESDKKLASTPRRFAARCVVISCICGTIDTTLPSCMIFKTLNRRRKRNPEFRAGGHPALLRFTF